MIPCNEIKNYGFLGKKKMDWSESGNEEQISNQRIRLLVSTFALLSVTVELYLTIRQIIQLNDE